MSMPAASRDTCSVVIIGAGFAGLSAAYTLKKAGVIAQIYEASETIGGRARRITEDGYVFDVGAQTTEPQWKTTFQYINELGLTDQVQMGSMGNATFDYVLGDKHHTFNLGAGKGKLLGSLIKFFFTGVPKRSYIQLIKFMRFVGSFKDRLDFKTGDFSALEEVSNLSIAEYARQNKEELADEYFLGPLLSMMVCDSTEKISMGHIILLMSLMEGMSSLECGLGGLAAKLAEQVEGQIHFNAAVQKVVIEDGQAKGILLADGTLVEADAVIVGQDAVTTRKLIPDLPKAIDKALATCDYSKTFVCQFGTSQRVIDDYACTMIFPKHSDSLFYSLSIINQSEGHTFINGLTRGEYFDEMLAMPERERLNYVIKHMQKYVPQLPNKFDIVKVFQWDRAINLEGPGQFEAINEMKAKHLDDVKGLYFAGDYLFLIASTEGSMNSGQLAGEKLLRDWDIEA